VYLAKVWHGQRQRATGGSLTRTRAREVGDDNSKTFGLQGFKVYQAMSVLLISFLIELARGLVNSSTLLFSGCIVIESFIF
jgi:hypothetical protein